jgi:hypothetical protein
VPKNIGTLKTCRHNLRHYSSFRILAIAAARQ